MRATLIQCLRPQWLMLIFLLAGLAACASKPEQNSPPPIPDSVRGEQAWGNAEWYTYQLAEELFAGLSANNQVRFAVATFVPVTDLSFQAQQQHPLMLLGHQLEQGMLTELARRGFVAQDFKATNDIKLQDSAETVFSRTIDDLYVHHHNVDFYLSGTLVEQQGGVLVNARIIDVQSKDVLAAATQFFPNNLFWQAEQVTTRGGLLYRSGVQ